MQNCALDYIKQRKEKCIFLIKCTKLSKQRFYSTYDSSISNASTCKHNIKAFNFINVSDKKICLYIGPKLNSQLIIRSINSVNLEKTNRFTLILIPRKGSTCLNSISHSVHRPMVTISISKHLIKVESTIQHIYEQI